MKAREWTQMLDQLQGALNQTSAEADRLEAAMATPLLTEDAGGKHFEEWTRRLDEAAERLQECLPYVDEAGSQAQTAEGELAVHEEQFRQYQKQLEELRQKLANVPAVAIE
jgi:chromosome segregation ATPase